MEMDAAAWEAAPFGEMALFNNRKTALGEMRTEKHDNSCKQTRFCMRGIAYAKINCKGKTVTQKDKVALWICNYFP